MTKSTPPTRRAFLAAGAAMGAAAGSPFLSSIPAVHGGSSEKLRIGLVGCGGRGSGAAHQALRAHPENVLVAMGDIFEDRLANSLGALVESDVGERVEVPEDRRFVGFDAIDRVLDSGVDVVLLATPPGFRPMHLEKCVAMGVHVFAEKPVATDAPGVRRVRAACDEAKKKNLTIVSGLCYRYEAGRRALMERLHAGAVGEILAIQGDYVTGELWSFPRKEGWSDLEWQLRNWLYYPWLSGDHIAEQHIHTLDVMAWIKQDRYPARALGLGGRQKRTDPLFGTVYDHFATIYEWEDGTRGYAHCRQQDNCARSLNEWVLGTKGRARVFQKTIDGENPWAFQGKAKDMYQAEHDALFAAIRSGRRIDNGDYMCNSTMMALMGRMAAYTGRQITWQEAWQSQEVLMPDDLDWNSKPPRCEVAVPGVTRFL
ncbi:MAG: Gfo/Idh/MocA family oxidoreductase [Planctomycetota bacterium]